MLSHKVFIERRFNNAHHLKIQYQN